MLRHRDPGDDVAIVKPRERVRHDAGNGEGMPVHGDRPPGHGGIGAETGAPESLRQQDDGRRVAPLVAGIEQASDERARPELGEIVRR